MYLVTCLPALIIRLTTSKNLIAIEPETSRSEIKADLTLTYYFTCVKKGMRVVLAIATVKYSTSSSMPIVIPGPVTYKVCLNANELSLKL